MLRVASTIFGVTLAALTAAGPALAAPQNFIRHGGGPHFGGGGQHFGNGGFRGGPRFGNGYRGPRYGGGYRHRGFGTGAAIGAGVAGLAAGALVGGALANRGYGYGYGYGDGYDGGYGYAQPPYTVVEQPTYVTPVAPGGDDVAYCMRRFKSYDPASGTYLGYDGLRHPCP